MRSELGDATNSDLLFDDMGGTLSTDSEGSYYTVHITSKALRAQGRTGTVGLYKVYQSGAYKLTY
ncbi:MAG: hypothetical protein ABF586_03095 [Sporolactobacillus sp.]